MSAAYGKLPLSFVANQGQSEKQVKFLARGQGYSLFLTPDRSGAEPARARRQSRTLTPSCACAWSAPIRIRSSPGLEPLPGTSNYFIGNDPARWQRDVPNYARVKYTGVYPGIDLVYYGNQRQLEYDLLVAPHADPARIALAFDGVQTLSLDADRQPGAPDRRTATSHSTSR